MHPRDFTREQLGSHYAIGTADQWSGAQNLIAGTNGLLRGRLDYWRGSGSGRRFAFTLVHPRTGNPNGGTVWIAARDIRGLWSDLEAAQAENLAAKRAAEEETDEARDDLARTARLAVTGVAEADLPYEVREILAGNVRPSERLKTLTARQLVTLMEDVRLAGGDA